MAYDERIEAHMAMRFFTSGGGNVLEEDTKSPYVWRCTQCFAEFEPTGAGGNDCAKHVREEHSVPAKEGVIFIDTKTDEVIQFGWSPTIAAKLARGGFIFTKRKEREESGMDDEFADKKERKRAELDALPKLTAKQREQASAFIQQTGRTTMKDVIIGRPVEILFYESQGIWPHLYGSGTTEQFSNFITEMVIAGAIAAGMNLGHIIAQEVAVNMAGGINLAEVSE